MKKLFLLLFMAVALSVTAQQTTVVVNQVTEEVPKGIEDGANVIFTLAHAPAPWASLALYRNGVRLRRCTATVLTRCDYTLVTPWNKIVFVPGQTPAGAGLSTPQDGDDIILADYKWNQTVIVPTPPVTQPIP